MYYQFKPKLSLTIVTFIVLSFFISLGFWQLHRADQKRKTLAAFKLNQQTVVLNMAEVSKEHSQLYYPVKLIGHFDAAHSFLLDNKIYQHQIGYQVVTPFHLDGTNKVVLINRGWIPMGASRSVLPTFETHTQNQMLIGLIQYPGQEFVLQNEANKSESWPSRIQIIDLQTIQKQLNHQVMSFTVLLKSDQPDGFIRDWQITTMKPEKHVAYAVQWFLFAFVLLVIYVALNLRKRESL